MNWLKKLLGMARGDARPTGNVVLRDEQWEEKKAALNLRLAAAPEDDALLVGIIGWHDRMLAEKVRQCDNGDLTGDQALSLCHQIAQIAAFRDELAETWRQQRVKARQPK